MWTRTWVTVCYRGLPSRGRNYPTLESVSEALFFKPSVKTVTSVNSVTQKPLPSPKPWLIYQSYPVSLKITKSCQSGQRANHRTLTSRLQEEVGSRRHLRAGHCPCPQQCVISFETLPALSVSSRCCALELEVCHQGTTCCVAHLV